MEEPIVKFGYALLGSYIAVATIVGILFADERLRLKKKIPTKRIASGFLALGAWFAFVFVALSLMAISPGALALIHAFLFMTISVLILRRLLKDC